jgi:hypothetical protein
VLTTELARHQPRRVEPIRAKPGRIIGAIREILVEETSGKRLAPKGPCAYAVVFIHRIVVMKQELNYRYFDIARTVALLSDGDGRFDVSGVEPGEYLADSSRRPSGRKPLRVIAGRTTDAGTIEYSATLCEAHRQLPFREELNLLRSPATIPSR